MAYLTKLQQLYTSNQQFLQAKQAREMSITFLRANNSPQISPQLLVQNLIQLKELTVKLIQLLNQMRKQAETPINFTVRVEQQTFHAELYNEQWCSMQLFQNFLAAMHLFQAQPVPVLQQRLIQLSQMFKQNFTVNFLLNEEVAMFQQFWNTVYSVAGQQYHQQLKQVNLKVLVSIIQSENAQIQAFLQALADARLKDLVVCTVKVEQLDGEEAEESEEAEPIISPPVLPQYVPQIQPILYAPPVLLPELQSPQYYAPAQQQPVQNYSQQNLLPQQMSSQQQNAQMVPMPLSAQAPPSEPDQKKAWRTGGRTPDVEVEISQLKCVRPKNVQVQQSQKAQPVQPVQKSHQQVVATKPSPKEPRTKSRTQMQQLTQKAEDVSDYEFNEIIMKTTKSQVIVVKKTKPVSYEQAVGSKAQTQIITSQTQQKPSPKVQPKVNPRTKIVMGTTQSPIITTITQRDSPKPLTEQKQVASGTGEWRQEVDHKVDFLLNASQQLPQTTSQFEDSNDAIISTIVPNKHTHIIKNSDYHEDISPKRRKIPNNMKFGGLDIGCPDSRPSSNISVVQASQPQQTYNQIAAKRSDPYQTREQQVKAKMDFRDQLQQRVRKAQEPQPEIQQSVQVTKFQQLPRQKQNIVRDNEMNAIKNVLWSQNTLQILTEAIETFEKSEKQRLNDQRVAELNVPVTKTQVMSWQELQKSVENIYKEQQEPVIQGQKKQTQAALQSVNYDVNGIRALLSQSRPLGAINANEESIQLQQMPKWVVQNIIEDVQRKAPSQIFKTNEPVTYQKLEEPPINKLVQPQPLPKQEFKQEPKPEQKPKQDNQGIKIGAGEAKPQPTTNQQEVKPQPIVVQQMVAEPPKSEPPARLPFVSDVKLDGKDVKNVAKQEMHCMDILPKIGEGQDDQDGEYLDEVDEDMVQ